MLYKYWTCLTVINSSDIRSLPSIKVQDNFYGKSCLYGRHLLFKVSSEKMMQEVLKDKSLEPIIIGFEYES